MGAVRSLRAIVDQHEGYCRWWQGTRSSVFFDTYHNTVYLLLTLAVSCITVQFEIELVKNFRGTLT